MTMRELLAKVKALEVKVAELEARDRVSIPMPSAPIVPWPTGTETPPLPWPYTGITTGYPRHIDSPLPIVWI